MESILLLFCQIKRNAKTVRTTHGGGQLGYLSLRIPPNYYTPIPGTAAFISPTDPDVFIVTKAPLLPSIRANTIPDRPVLTNADITIQKTTFNNSLQLYNKCQALELALRNQITDAFEPEYLSALQNSVTDVILTNIPVIMTFLQETNRKISPTNLIEKEDTMKDFVYNPAEPIDTVFNKIDCFSDVCEL